MPTVERLIRDTYLSTGSIKATARELKISEQSVRRVLLQCGDYTNDTAKRIHSLLEAGKTVEEISGELHINKNTVISYLPYSRTPYISPEKTENAKRIKQCRERKNRMDGGCNA